MSLSAPVISSRHPLSLLALCAALGWPPGLAAEEVAPGLSGSSYLQTFLALLLVIGVFAGAAWLMRRVGMVRPSGAGGIMKVVGTLVVAPRERILLIEIGDTWLVVASSPGQMRTLHTLPRPPEGVGIPTDEPSFAHWLKQLGDRPGQSR